jgi:hypothetical protein
MTKDPRSARSRTIGIAALTGCVAALGGGGYALAVPSGVLGPPNYNGYCQKQGFIRSTFTAGTNKRWACERSGGTAVPMDVQAACEFSYSTRPIKAVELAPGVLFTWQCERATGSAGGGGSSGGGGGGGSSSGPGQSGPAPVVLSSSWIGALMPTGKGAKLAALLRRGGYEAKFHTSVAGTVVIYWYRVPKGAHLAKAKPKPVLIAAGKTGFSRAGTPAITVRLNRRGKALLKHAARMKLTAKGTFTPLGGAASRALRTFTLKR